MIQELFQEESCFWQYLLLGRLEEMRAGI